MDMELIEKGSMFGFHYLPHLRIRTYFNLKKKRFHSKHLNKAHEFNPPPTHKHKPCS